MDSKDAPIDILLVEDDQLHVEMTLHTFERAGLVNAVHTVNSGEKAVDFLHRRPPYEDAPENPLVLLDLNLPGLGGHEVLQSIRNDPKTAGLRVAMLTSSRFGEDILMAHEEGANGYLVKPVSKEGLTALIEQLGNISIKIVVKA